MPLLTSRRELPVPLTSFIGRERELAEVSQLMRVARLVTLTGAGGIGKTRLVLEAARASPEEYPDGTALVFLAPIVGPHLVAPTIAQALGVRENPEQPLRDTLVAYLRPLHLLLVVDNFEHVLDGAPLISDLLESCPHLAVLATSREVLGLGGEREFSVPPLELPPADRDAPAALLMESASAQLFAQRAAQSGAEFAWTTDGPRTIADICLRLDGLPLAIELAAALTRLLSPPQLLSRLDHRLPLLVGGARDLPARQRTLRATITWSHDLLEPGDQRLFRRLAVFSGGCTLGAAETLCQGDADLGRPVLDGLGSLVDKNLLLRDGGIEAEPRFVMLETIREFGIEQLAACEEGELLAERHAAYFLALAEQAEAPVIMGPSQVEWVERLDREHNNLRAAISWAHAHDAVEVELRLSTALANFWMMRGHIDEGLGRLAAGLAHGHAVPAVLRAKALGYAGYMTVLQGDKSAAERLVNEADALVQDSWGPPLRVLLLITRGILARARGQNVEAVERFGHAIATLQHVGVRPPSMLRWQYATSLLSQGDVERSSSLHEENLADALAGGDTWAAAAVLGDLAVIALMRADFDRASSRLAEALALASKLRDVLITEFCVEAMAAIAGSRNRPRQVALLLGAADRLCSRSGLPSPGSAAIQKRWPLPAGLDAAHLLRTSRNELGEPVFAAIWEAGRTLPLEQVLAEALSRDALVDSNRGMPDRLPTREGSFRQRVRRLRVAEP
jgi:predicted ATPase